MLDPATAAQYAAAAAANHGYDMYKGIFQLKKFQKLKWFFSISKKHLTRDLDEWDFEFCYGKMNEELILTQCLAK